MKKILPPIFFLILATTIIFSWFRHGLIYGGGDVGLQTYNLQRIFEIAKYVWWEATAPGSPIPQGLTAVPFNFLFLILQKIGFTPLILQATLFFLILLFMGSGMYFLILFIFGSEFKKYAILAGLFYMFNPYMMISVWHRFVHTTFFLVAALPFFLIYWLKWLRTGKISSLLAFLIVTLLSLYAFGTIAYLITVWLILLLVTIPEIIFPWTGINNFKKISFRFLIGFFIWLITNGWWIVPIFNIAPGFLSEQHTSEETLVTVTNLAHQTVLPYFIQMINPFYLFWQLDFGESYLHIIIRLLPWIFVLIILFGAVKSLKYKNLASWGFIYLVVFLLSKGAASPFGNIFAFGIEHFFSLGVLRNPFEKIGVLLPLISSILLVLGTKYIFDLLKKKLNYQLASLLILIITAPIFLFAYPMYIGQIFGKYNKPEYVEVPTSYKKANEWIKTDYLKDAQSNPGKILHLPLTRGESITYKWNHGYSGLEASALFFTSIPSISHGFNIKRVDDSLTALSLGFHKPYFKDPQKLLQILEDFNVRYIVLHKDVKWQGGDLYDPQQTEDILDSLNSLGPAQQFGDLIIYKLNDKYFQPKISLTSHTQLIFPSDNGTIWPWLIGDGANMITPVDHDLDESTLKLVNQILVFPKSSFNYQEASASAMLATINQIKTDQLERVKPILVQNGEVQAEKLNEKLISINQEIVKVLRSQSEVENYYKQLKDIFSANLRNSRLLLYVNEKDISLIFQIHLYALKTLGDQADPMSKNKIADVYNFLKDQLVKNNLITQFPQNLATEEKIFKFQIPKSMQYEILKIEGLTTNVLSQKTDFESGLKEIGYPILYSGNLVQPLEKMIKSPQVEISDETIQITPQGGLGYIENPLSNVQGGDIFRVSFEVMAKNGNGFYFQLVQDTDSLDQNNQPVHQLNEFIDLHLKQNNWQIFSFSLPQLRLTTQQAAIRFVVAANQQILNSPSILIKNLRIEKMLNNNLVLRGILSQSKDNDPGGQVLNINQKSPVLYQGKINIEKPTFLIFSETYHPGWKLTLKGENKVYLPQKHFLANLYGNAWFVEENGKYDFRLEFEPQRQVWYGWILSCISYGGLILYLIVSKLRKI